MFRLVLVSVRRLPVGNLLDPTLQDSQCPVARRQCPPNVSSDEFLDTLASKEEAVCLPLSLQKKRRLQFGSVSVLPMQDKHKPSLEERLRLSHMGLGSKKLSFQVDGDSFHIHQMITTALPTHWWVHFTETVRGPKRAGFNLCSRGKCLKYKGHCEAGQIVC